MWPAIGVRAVASIGFRPLKEVAAKAAFWSLGIGYLTRFAAHLRYPLLDKASIIEVLLVLVTSILKVSETDAMDIIALRMALVGSNSRFQVDVLEMDDAEAVLDHHDRTTCKDEEKKGDDDICSGKSFCTTYRAKKKELVIELSKGKKKRATKG